MNTLTDKSVVTPLIVAHRGASANAPENTLAAFRAAMDARADGIELDVRLAADGVPVVIHDKDLRRTGRSNARVSDLTVRQLGAMDVGSWFNAKHPGLARPEFSAQTVPSLSQVLALLDEFTGLVYVELKCEADESEALAAAVCEMVAGGRASRTVIKSFYLPALSVVRRVLPEISTAALFEPSIMTIFGRRRHLIALAREHGADQISLHRSLARPRLLSLAAQARMPVSVWTVDDPIWIGRSRRLGIRSIVTNDPARLIAARVPG